MRRAGIIANSALAVGLMAAVTVGGVWVANATGDLGAAEQSADPALATEAPPYVGTDENGLAAEQEAAAAAGVEAARLAAEAEAEAARVAAEQAAAAEAQRLAAEAAQAESFVEAPAEEPAADPWAGKTPATWVPSPDPINAPGGGSWTGCPNAQMSTGPDGVVYCD